MGKFDGKVSVITGGARGIGRQMAIAFATEGADIVIGDLIEMNEVIQEIQNLGRNVIAIKTDVTKKADVENMVDTAVTNYKRIDILVNNAGIGNPASLLEMTEADWDTVLNVNLKGVFLCTQAVAKQMIKRKCGKIINMASAVGIGRVFPGQANYASSKAGVIQLTKVSALELGPFGITVNAICPGTIVTDLMSNRRSPEELERFFEEKKKVSVLNRLGTPQDVAGIALFLASEDSSFITGQVIIADGGRL